MKKEFVSLNGSMVPKEDAKISVFDRGFLYGDGVFETLRIYDCIPFMLDEHMERLIAGLKALRFQKLPAGIKVYVSRLIETNKVKNGVLRIAVSRGELSSGIDPSACKEPTVVISAKEGIPYNDEAYLRGFRAIVAKIRKDQNSPLCRVKSANFLTHILAKGEATDAGVDEAIMLNHNGLVAEATISNIFIVKENTLVTPSLESGILPGITRRIVLEIAEDAGIKTEEKRMKPEEIYSAGEAFLTNSLMEVMPMVEIDKRPIGNGLPGKVSVEIRKRYKELVR